jgi:hypothetical protein
VDGKVSPTPGSSSLDGSGSRLGRRLEASKENNGGFSSPGGNDLTPRPRDDALFDLSALTSSTMNLGGFLTSSPAAAAPTAQKEPGGGGGGGSISAELIVKLEKRIQDLEEKLNNPSKKKATTPRGPNKKSSGAALTRGKSPTRSPANSRVSSSSSGRGKSPGGNSRPAATL